MPAPTIGDLLDCQNETAELPTRERAAEFGRLQARIEETYLAQMKEFSEWLARQDGEIAQAHPRATETD